MNKTGLTLGKFAPLHRGHQFVIETMPAENDEAIVVIYDSPEVTPIPLQVRAAWIEKLYPSVRVIGAWGGPQQTGDSPRIKKLHEDYLIRELEISGITHFYSVWVNTPPLAAGILYFSHHRFLGLVAVDEKPAVRKHRRHSLEPQVAIDFRHHHDGDFIGRRRLGDEQY